MEPDSSPTDERSLPSSKRQLQPKKISYFDSQNARKEFAIANAPVCDSDKA